MSCPRVSRRIECPECGYPYSEAAVGLDEVDDDPGHGELESNFDEEVERQLAIALTALTCVATPPCNHEWCPCGLPPDELASFDVVGWARHHGVSKGITKKLLELKRRTT